MKEEALRAAKAFDEMDEEQMMSSHTGISETLVSEAPPRIKKQKSPSIVISTTLFLFGKPSWEIQGFENGVLTTELIAEMRSKGQELKERLEFTAEALSKLSKMGWDGEGGLYDFTVHRVGTLEQAETELLRAGFDLADLEVIEEDLEELDSDSKEVQSPAQTAKMLNEELMQLRDYVGRLKSQRDEMQKQLKSQSKENKRLKRNENSLIKSVALNAKDLHFFEIMLDELLTETEVVQGP